MLCSTIKWTEPQSRIYTLAAIMIFAPAARNAIMLFLALRTGSAVMLFNLHHDVPARDAHNERVRTAQTLTGLKSNGT
jgi:hypothetical protein